MRIKRNHLSRKDNLPLCFELFSLKRKLHWAKCLWNCIFYRLGQELRLFCTKMLVSSSKQEKCHHGTFLHFQLLNRQVTSYAVFSHWRYDIYIEGKSNVSQAPTCSLKRS